jgi:hypothetical protein
MVDLTTYIKSRTPGDTFRSCIVLIVKRRLPTLFHECDVRTYHPVEVRPRICSCQYHTQDYSTMNFRVNEE